jgi:trehalose 6-phosphate phosphatase
MTLPESRTEAGQAGLAALIAHPADALIAVDFDGTLAPIVARAEDARPLAGALDALIAVAGAFGHVGVVTGRPAGWLVEVAGLDAIPRLVIVGQYGAERWSAGELTRSEPPPGLAAIRTALPDLVAGTQARIEDKGLSVVVHTRGASDPEAALAALAAPVRALARRNGLAAHPGRAVIEIRPTGFDKGRALRDLVEECAARAVLFAGDDLGDLPAFAAIEELRESGHAGVTVCSASAEMPSVAERADLVVDGPAGVADLLSALSASVLSTGG